MEGHGNSQHGQLSFYNPTRNHEYVNYLNSVPNRKFNNSKKLKDLVIDRYYPVTAFKTVNGKFGKACVVTLYDERDPWKNKFDVFLPKRYDYIEANANVQNVQMAYKGKEITQYGCEAHKVVLWTS